ncbi:helix-turn-helix domain-containing protein [Rhodococcus triatomae]
MTTTRGPEELVADLARQVARETAAKIAKLRNVRQLHEHGYTQVQLATILGVSQPAISDMLRRARIDAPDVRPGTHGGTAYEIAARYAAGEIDRAVALRELAEWEYEPEDAPNPNTWLNDGTPPVRGSVATELDRVMRARFLTDTDYDTLLDALAAN